MPQSSEDNEYLDPRTYEGRQKRRIWAFHEAMRISSGTEVSVDDVIEDAKKIAEYIETETDEYIPHPKDRQNNHYYGGSGGYSGIRSGGAFPGAVMNASPNTSF